MIECKIRENRQVQALISKINRKLASQVPVVNQQFRVGFGLDYGDLQGGFCFRLFPLKDFSDR